MSAEMDNTMFFDSLKSEKASTREILMTVYGALEEKGYDAVNQIVGYLISGDPAYITSYQNARNLMTKLDRDEVLEELVKYYLKGN